MDTDQSRHNSNGHYRMQMIFKYKVDKIEINLSNSAKQARDPTMSLSCVRIPFASCHLHSLALFEETQRHTVQLSIKGTYQKMRL